jgi:hypothetical protein
MVNFPKVGDSRVFDPSARVVAKTSVLVAAMLAALLIIAALINPGGWASAHPMPPRDYHSASLASVMADLERSEVIGKGTSWEKGELKTSSVTLAFWTLPEGRAALEEIARVAKVEIEVPWLPSCLIGGGEIAGSVRVRSAGPAGPRVVLIPYRRP